MATERDLDLIRNFYEEKCRLPSADDPEVIFRTLSYAGFTVTTILNKATDAQGSDKTIFDILNEFELGLMQQLFYAEHSDPPNRSRKFVCDVSLNVISDLREYLEKEKNYG